MNDNYRLFKLVRMIKPAAREENAIIDSSLVANNVSNGNVNILNKLILKIPELNTSKWVSCSFLFYNCANLQTIPDLDTYNTKNMESMFRDCVSLQTIPNLDTSNVTNMTYMFYGCTNLQTIPNLNTSKVSNIEYIFSRCTNLQTIPSLDTSAVTKMGYMFKECRNLIEIPSLDCSMVRDLRDMFHLAPNIINIGGLINVGKAFTQKTVNYMYYRLNFASPTKLTHESLMNIINNLYDLNLTYDVANGGTLYTQTLCLETTNMAKLTAEEIAIATNKGWTVS